MATVTAVENLTRLLEDLPNVRLAVLFGSTTSQPVAEVVHGLRERGVDATETLSHRESLGFLRVSESRWPVALRLAGRTDFHHGLLPYPALAALLVAYMNLVAGVYSGGKRSATGITQPRTAGSASAISSRRYVVGRAGSLARWTRTTSSFSPSTSHTTSVPAAK